MKRPLIIVCAWLLSSLAPRTVRADSVELSIGSVARSLGSPSADAVTGDSAMGAFSALAARKLRGLTDRTDLLIEGGFEVGFLDGTTFQRIDTHLSAITATIGLRLRRPVWKLITSHARVAIGGARVALSLTDVFSAVDPLEDTGYAAVGYLGGGLSAMPVRLRNGDGTTRFAFGVTAEVGYLATSAVTMNATPSGRGDGDSLQIPVSAASLGALDLSGWGIRIGLVTRF